MAASDRRGHRAGALTHHRAARSSSPGQPVRENTLQVTTRQPVDGDASDGVGGHPGFLARMVPRTLGPALREIDRARKACACGAPLPPYRGTGRPRKRCTTCAADKSALAKAWRASHRERVAAFHRARLRPWPSSPAVTNGRLRRPSKYLPDRRSGREGGGLPS
jgi:hypothetical protein